MKSVAIPEDKFASTGFAFSIPEGSSIGTFTYPKRDEEKETRVSVVTDGSTLRFFPDRSAAQAKLLADLGLNTV